MVRRAFPWVALALVAAACADHLAEAVSNGGANDGGAAGDGSTPPVTTTSSGDPPPIDRRDDAGDPFGDSSVSEASTPDSGGVTLIDAGDCSACPAKACDPPTGTTCALHAFVTSQAHDGQFNLGATTTPLAALDNVCRALALAASFPGVYLAWAWTTTSGSDQPPWMRLLGNRIDSGRAWFSGGLAIGTLSQLAKGTLLHPIQYTELGKSLTTSVPVWTGILENGAAGTGDCAGWSNGTTSFGTFGINTDTAHWLSTGMDQKCATPAHLYCFQQP